MDGQDGTHGSTWTGNDCVLVQDAQQVLDASGIQQQLPLYTLRMHAFVALLYIARSIKMDKQLARRFGNSQPAPGHAHSNLRAQ